MAGDNDLERYGVSGLAELKSVGSTPAIDVAVEFDRRDGATRRYHVSKDRSLEDDVVAEEPLEIRVQGDTLAITMRTPGSDLDLAVGFLFTEAIIHDVNQILSMRAEPAAEDPADPAAEDSSDRVTIHLKPEVSIDPARIRRNFYTSSSCGVCGKLAIGAIEVHPSPPMRQSGPQFHTDLIYRLPDLLRQTQQVFERTGGLHAAALFSTEGRLLGLREDVGRHNAVDKLIGFALRDGAVALRDSLILMSCVQASNWCRSPQWRRSQFSPRSARPPVWPWIWQNVLA